MIYAVRPILLLFIPMFILCAYEPVFARADLQVQDDEQKIVKEYVRKTRLDNVRVQNSKALQKVYEENNYQPLWMTGSRKDFRLLNDFYELFLDSWVHGFNPGKYHTPSIYNSLAKIKEGKTLDDKIKADIILSDAIIKFGQDLTGTRINPRKLGYNSKSIRKPGDPAALLQYILSSRNPVNSLRGLAPKSNFYKALQSELILLYQNPDDDVKPIKVGRLIKPRSSHGAIPAIRERLGVSDQNLMHEANFYDDLLSKRVIEFQKKNGLKPDGVIGPATMRILNMNDEDRIKQIIVNMERARWELDDASSRYIMVNIPNQTLFAVDNGRTKIQMPIVIGRTDRPTNSFQTNIDGVRFNPTWTIPRTIKREDFISKLKEDPNYLMDRGINLYYEREQIDSTLVDWNALPEEEYSSYRMVQGSGLNNPLGRFRILMPNPYNIYLHDTPQKSVFQRTNRALSSGCIRLQDAEKVVDFILQDKNGWSEERKQDILDAGKMRDIFLENPIPVYLNYQTMWFDDKNKLVYGPDVYKEDINLFSALKSQNDVYLPSDRGI
ncbi:MAG: L,D-transpeptidase family protein [Pseudomonadota bacterium]